MSAAVQKEHQTKLTDWTQCWFDEDKKTGYVTVTDFNFKKSYGLKDINALRRDTEGVEKRFMTLNGFTFGQRKTGELRQIRNIGIDIDQYKFGLTIEEALDELQVMILDRIIPEPNLILTSRGIQIFYTIENGASPQMAQITSFITDQYISKLRHLGADSNAKDVARVMRVPYSINERNGAVVTPEIWNPYPYTLQELQAYCKPLDQFRHKGKRKAKIKLFDENLYFFYRTNHARLRDLDRLIHLRDGDFSNTRNTFIYIYAFHQALVCSSLKDTQSFMYDVYDRIHSRTDSPMSKRELDRTIRSAYKDSEKFFKHYKENNYRVVYRMNDGIIKPYKTSNLIDKLKITEDEQRELKSIHTGVVSKEKDAERKRNERRASGMKSMKEYSEDRKKKQLKRLDRLRQIIDHDPSITKKELAAMLGVSTRTIRRDMELLKDIAKEEEQKESQSVHVEDPSKEKGKYPRYKRCAARPRSRQEYNNECQEQTKDKLWLLQKAMTLYPHSTNNQLARLLAISGSYVKKLKVKIRGGYRWT